MICADISIEVLLKYSGAVLQELNKIAATNTNSLSVKELVKNLYNRLESKDEDLNRKVLLTIGNTSRILNIIENKLDPRNSNNTRLLELYSNINFSELNELKSIYNSFDKQIEKLLEFIGESKTSTTNTTSTSLEAELLTYSNVESKDLETSIQKVESLKTVYNTQEDLDKINSVLKTLNENLSVYQTQQTELLKKQKEVDNLNEELNKLIATITSQNESFINLQSELDKMTDVNANLEQETLKTVEAYNQLKTVKAELQTEIAKLNGYISDLNLEVANNTIDKTQGDSILKSYQAKLDELTLLNDELKDSLEEHIKAKEELEKEVLQKNNNFVFQEGNKPVNVSGWDVDGIGIKVEESGDYVIITKNIPKYDSLSNKWTHEVKTIEIKYNNPNNPFARTLQLLKELKKYEAEIRTAKYHIEYDKVISLLNEGKLIIHGYSINKNSDLKEQTKQKQSLFKKLFNKVKNLLISNPKAERNTVLNRSDLNEQLGITDGNFVIKRHNVYEDNTDVPANYTAIKNNIFTIEFTNGVKTIEIGRVRVRLGGENSSSLISNSSNPSALEQTLINLTALNNTINLNVEHLPFLNVKPPRYNSDRTYKVEGEKTSRKHLEWKKALELNGYGVSNLYIITASKTTDYKLNKYSLNSGSDYKKGISGRTVSFISNGQYTSDELNQVVEDTLNKIRDLEEKARTNKTTSKKEVQEELDKLLNDNYIQMVVMQNSTLSLDDYFNNNPLIITGKETTSSSIDNLLETLPTLTFDDFKANLVERKVNPSSFKEHYDLDKTKSFTNDELSQKIYPTKDSLFNEYQTKSKLSYAKGNNDKGGLLEKLYTIFTGGGEKSIFEENNGFFTLTDYALNTFPFLKEKVKWTDITHADHLSNILNDVKRLDENGKFDEHYKKNPVEGESPIKVESAQANQPGVSVFSLADVKYKNDLITYAKFLKLEDKWNENDEQGNLIYYSPQVDNTVGVKTSLFSPVFKSTQSMLEAKSETSNDGMDFPSFVVDLKEFMSNLSKANETQRKADEERKRQEELNKVVTPVTDINESIKQQQEEEKNKEQVKKQAVIDYVVSLTGFTENSVEFKQTVSDAKLRSDNVLSLLRNDSKQLNYFKELFNTDKPLKAVIDVLNNLKLELDNNNVDDFIATRQTPENYQPEFMSNQKQVSEIYNRIFGTDYFVDYSNNKIIEDLKNRLSNNEISLEQYNKILKEIQEQGYNDFKRVLGYTYRDIVQLNTLQNGLVENETAYHEAFHRVFKMLNPLYKQRILNEAKERFGDFNDKVLEEKLADEYGKTYAKYNDKSILSSIGGKFGTWVRQLFNKIKGLFNIFNSIDSLYNDITTGYYVGFEINEDLTEVDFQLNPKNRNSKLYEQLDEKVFGKDDGFGNLKRQRAILDTIADVLDKTIYEKIYEKRNGKPVDFLTAFNEVKSAYISKYKSKFIENYTSDSLLSLEEIELKKQEISEEQDISIDSITVFKIINDEGEDITNFSYPINIQINQEDNFSDYVLQKLFTPAILNTTDKDDKNSKIEIIPFDVIVEQKYGLIKEERNDQSNSDVDENLEDKSFEFKNDFTAEKSATMSEELRQHIRNTPSFYFANTDTGVEIREEKEANGQRKYVDVGRVERFFKDFFRELKQDRRIDTDYNERTFIRQRLENEIERSIGETQKVALSIYLRFYADNNAKYKYGEYKSFYQKALALNKSGDLRNLKLEGLDFEYYKMYMKPVALFTSFFKNLYVAKFVNSDINKGVDILDKTSATAEIINAAKGVLKSSIIANTYTLSKDKDSATYKDTLKAKLKKIGELQTNDDFKTSDGVVATLKIGDNGSTLNKNVEYSSIYDELDKIGKEKFEQDAFKKYVDALYEIVNAVIPYDKSTIHNVLIDSIIKDSENRDKSSYVNTLALIAGDIIAVDSGKSRGLIVDIMKDIDATSSTPLMKPSITANYTNISNLAGFIESAKSINSDSDTMIKSADNENINTNKNENTGEKIRRQYKQIANTFKNYLASKRTTDTNGVEVIIPGETPSSIMKKEEYQNYVKIVPQIKTLFNEIYQNAVLTGKIIMNNVLNYNALTNDEEDKSKNMIAGSMRELTGFYFSEFLNVIKEATSATTGSKKRMLIPDVTNSDKNSQYSHEVTSNNFDDLFYSFRNNDNKLLEALKEQSDAAKSYFRTVTLLGLKSYALLANEQGIDTKFQEVLNQVDALFTNPVIDNNTYQEAINLINNHLRVVRDGDYELMKSTQLRMATTGKESKKKTGDMYRVPTEVKGVYALQLNSAMIEAILKTPEKALEDVKAQIKKDAISMQSQNVQIEFNQIKSLEAILSIGGNSYVNSLKETYDKFKEGLGKADKANTTKIYDEINETIHPLIEDFLLTFTINSFRIGVVQNGMNFLYGDYVDLAKRSINIQTAMESPDLTQLHGLPPVSKMIIMKDFRTENFIGDSQFKEIYDNLSEEAKGDAFDGGGFMNMLQWLMQRASFGDKYPNLSTQKPIYGAYGVIVKNAYALLNNQYLDLSNEYVKNLNVQMLGGYDSPLYKQWVTIREVNLKAKYPNTSDYNRAINNNEDWELLYEWFVNNRNKTLEELQQGFKRSEVKDGVRVEFNTLDDLFIGLAAPESAVKIAPQYVNDISKLNVQFNTIPVDNSMMGLVTNISQETKGSTIAAATQEFYITAPLGDNYTQADEIYTLLGQLSKQGLETLETELKQKDYEKESNPEKRRQKEEERLNYFVERLQFILEQTKLQSNTYSLAVANTDPNHPLLNPSFQGAISSTIKKYTSKLRFEGRRDTVQSSTGFVNMYDLLDENGNDVQSLTKSQAIKKGLITTKYKYQTVNENNEVVEVLLDSFNGTDNYKGTVEEVNSVLKQRELNYEILTDENGNEIRGNELSDYVKALKSYELNTPITLSEDSPYYAELKALGKVKDGKIKSKDYIDFVKDKYTFKDMEIMLHRDTFAAFELNEDEDVNDVNDDYFKKRLSEYHNLFFDELESNPNLTLEDLKNKKLLNKSLKQWQIQYLKQLGGKKSTLDYINEKTTKELSDFKNRLIVKVTRIPVTGLNSIQFAKVVGFYSGQGNTALVPSHLLITSGADNDGDMVTLEFYDLSNDKKGDVVRQLFDVKKQAIKSPFNLRQKFLPIDMSGLDRFVKLAEQLIEINFNSFATSIQILLNNQAGKTGIGAYVKLSEIYHNLYRIAKVSQSRLADELYQMEVTIGLDNLKQLDALYKTEPRPNVDFKKYEKYKAKQQEVLDAGSFNKPLFFNGKKYDNVLGLKILKQIDEASLELDRQRTEGLVTTTTTIDRSNMIETVEHINQWLRLNGKEELSQDSIDYITNYKKGDVKRNIEGIRYVGDEMYKEDYMMLTKVIEIVSNAALDNAKEAKLGALNITPITWSLHEGMVLANVDENDTLLLMTHPVLVNILAELNKDASIYTEEGKTSTLAGLVSDTLFTKLGVSKQSDEKYIKNYIFQELYKRELDRYKTSEIEEEQKLSYEFEIAESVLNTNKQANKERYTELKPLRKSRAKNRYEAEELNKQISFYTNFSKNKGIKPETLVKYNDNILKAQNRLEVLTKESETLNTSITKIEQQITESKSLIEKAELKIEVIYGIIKDNNKKQIAEELLKYEGDDNKTKKELLDTNVTISRILETTTSPISFEHSDLASENLTNLGISKTDKRYFKPARMLLTKAESLLTKKVIEDGQEIDTGILVFDDNGKDAYGNRYAETQEEWDERKGKLQYFYAAIHQFEQVGQEINNLRNLMSFTQGIKGVEKENAKQIRMLIQALGYTDMLRTMSTYEVLSYIKNNLLLGEKSSVDSEIEKQPNFIVISPRLFAIENEFLKQNILALIKDYELKQEMIITKNPIVSNVVDSMKEQVKSGDKGKDDKLKKEVEKELSKSIIGKEFLEQAIIDTKKQLFNNDGVITFEKRLNDVNAIYGGVLSKFIDLDLSTPKSRYEFSQNVYTLVQNIKSLSSDETVSKSVPYKRMMEFLKNTVLDTTKDNIKIVNLIRLRDVNLKNKLRAFFENMTNRNNVSIDDRNHFAVATLLTEVLFIYSVYKDNVNLSNGSFAEVLTVESNEKYSDIMRSKRVRFNTINEQFLNSSLKVKNNALLDLKATLDSDLSKLNNGRDSDAINKDISQVELEIGNKSSEIKTLKNDVAAIKKINSELRKAKKEQTKEQRAEITGKVNTNLEYIKLLTENLNTLNTELETLKSTLFNFTEELKQFKTNFKTKEKELKDKYKKDELDIKNKWTIRSFMDNINKAENVEEKQSNIQLANELESLSNTTDRIIEENPEFAYRFNPTEKFGEKTIKSFGTVANAKSKLGEYDVKGNDFNYEATQIHPNVMNYETVVNKLSPYTKTKFKELEAKGLKYIHIKTYDPDKKTNIVTLYKLVETEKTKSFVKLHKSTYGFGNNYSNSSNSSQLPVYKNNEFVTNSESLNNSADFIKHVQEVKKYYEDYRQYLDKNANINNLMFTNGEVVDVSNNEKIQQLISRQCDVK